MPSYIELDQNTTFPSASGAGKVVFGINVLGSAVVVDSNGNTLVLSQSAATGSGIFSGSFYGDGSGLTNVPGTGGGSADGNLVLSFVSKSTFSIFFSIAFSFTFLSFCLSHQRCIFL